MKAAAGLTTVGFAKPTLGAPKHVGAEQADLTDEVTELIAAGNDEKAEHLLDEANVDHDHNKRHVKNYGPKSSKPKKADEKKVSKHWYYARDEDGIELDCWMWRSRDDRWKVLGKAAYNDGSTASGEKETSVRLPQWAADGCGIVFDHAEWSAPTPGPEGVKYYDGSRVSINHSEYNPNHGPAAKVRMDGQDIEPDRVMMRTELTQDSGTGNDDIDVQFAYNHTIAYPSNPGDVSVGIAYGALTVKVPFGATKPWDGPKEVTASP